MHVSFVLLFLPASAALCTWRSALTPLATHAKSHARRPLPIALRYLPDGKPDVVAASINMQVGEGPSGAPSPSPPSRMASAARYCTDRIPGVGVAWIIAVGATRIADRTAVSPLLWASVLGIGAGSVARASTRSTALTCGVGFAKARLLRLGIILYGLKLSVQQISGIGIAGLLADLFTVTSTMALGLLIGVRAMGLAPPLASLIATGAAICGCSAVAAAQPVVDGEAHEVAAAVGTVVFCGTLAMFLYPALYANVGFLAANPRLMGIYTGATVHELAGVVAASTAMGADVSAIAIVTKLVRVTMLAPMLLLMSRFPALRSRGNEGTASSPTSAGGLKAPLPWFALGFVALSVLNSVATLDRALLKAAGAASAACLAMAMAALGFDADLGKIRQLGPKPLLLAATLWAWLLLVGGGVARLLTAAFP